MRRILAVTAAFAIATGAVSASAHDTEITRCDQEGQGSEPTGPRRVEHPAELR